jgi:hypothetical protein
MLFIWIIKKKMGHEKYLQKHQGSKSWKWDSGQTLIVNK